MFRTNYDSKGKPHVAFDSEFAAGQAALQQSRGVLSRTQNSLSAYKDRLQTAYQMIERSNVVDAWRQSVINAVANTAQDEHAVAVGYRAAFEFLRENPHATDEQIKEISEAARKAASGDGALLTKTVDIQRKLKPRSLS